jgi:hypothetical protein
MKSKINKIIAVIPIAIGYFSIILFFSGFFIYTWQHFSLCWRLTFIGLLLFIMILFIAIISNYTIRKK